MSVLRNNGAARWRKRSDMVGGRAHTLSCPGRRETMISGSGLLTVAIIAMMVVMIGGRCRWVGDRATPPQAAAAHGKSP
jgi:hypothetical protein